MQLAREVLLQSIGALIRERRQRLHLTQNDLATKLEITRNTVSNIEHGRHSPSILTLYSIASELNVPPQDLLPGATTETLLRHKLKLRGIEEGEASTLASILQPPHNASS